MSEKQNRFLQMIKKKSSKKGEGIGPSEEAADEMIKKSPSKKRSLFTKKK